MGFRAHNPCRVSADLPAQRVQAVEPGLFLNRICGHVRIRAYGSFPSIRVPESCTLTTLLISYHYLVVLTHGSWQISLAKCNAVRTPVQFGTHLAPECRPGLPRVARWKRGQQIGCNE